MTERLERLLAERLLYVQDLGLVDYDEAWEFQKAAAKARIAGKHARNGDVETGTNTVLGHDLLILCQHPPVVTLGRSTKPGNLLASPAYLQSRGIQLRDVERGGDVTIHEPGQLVAYPILDLEQHRRDLHWYLRQVEEVVIVALRSFGLEGGRREGLTGVWVEGRKIASIGVHARDWVTWHGVAINVVNDLSTFAHVVPCGIDQVEMTTVAMELARHGTPTDAASNSRHGETDLVDRTSTAIRDAMAAVFKLQMVEAQLLLPY
jgi:lipoyl(octanoyl) transferase